MRRFAVMGISGNGKTTLSRRLAAQLDVPYVELDAIYHQPGWTELPLDEFRARVDEATRGDGWVVDGSYREFVGDIVLGRAETVVWLDQPLALVLWRLSRRAVRDIRTQRDLFNGNRQNWRFAFFQRDSLVSYAASQHLKRRREWPEWLATFPHLEVVRLRSPGEVERWLDAQGTRVR
jgi:adenylate kinase family enzyme